MKKYSLYPLVTVISFIIRQFVLPNPFDCFGDKALFINHIAEPVIIVVAYFLVGLVYKKGSVPAIGSLLFLATYATIVGILGLLGLFKFAWWWILVLVVSFVGSIILLRKLCIKHENERDWD